MEARVTASISNPTNGFKQDYPPEGACFIYQTTTVCSSGSLGTMLPKLLADQSGSTEDSVKEKTPTAPMIGAPEAALRCLAEKRVANDE